MLAEKAGICEAGAEFGSDGERLRVVAVGSVGGEENVDIDGGVFEEFGAGAVEQEEHVGVFGGEEAAGVAAP